MAAVEGTAQVPEVAQGGLEVLVGRELALELLGQLVRPVGQLVVREALLESDGVGEGALGWGRLDGLELGLAVVDQVSSSAIGAIAARLAQLQRLAALSSPSPWFFSS